MEKSVIHHTNSPRTTVVSTTPSVERAIPCHMTGRTEDHSVSKPPENRMKLRATMPMNCASPGSSNGMRPIPSEPASMPITRKIIRVGTPMRKEVLPASTLMKTRIEPMSSMFSVVIVTGRAISGLKDMKMHCRDKKIPVVQAGI